MTQVAWVKHGAGVRSLKQVDGCMMYKDDFEYNSHLSTTCTFNLPLT